MMLETSSSQIFNSGQSSNSHNPTLTSSSNPLHPSHHITSGACLSGNSGANTGQILSLNQQNSASNAHSFVNTMNGTASVEEQLMKLEHFLNTAPNTFSPNETVKRFPLGNNETISCAYWKGSFFISGTDIVKILSYRVQLIGKTIHNQKKFEEGIFSDLRSLKPGADSLLEEARSEFLEMLYKSGCVRTQKKQKVFFWYSVPHERLFLDAIERDRKRESLFNPCSGNTNSLSVMPQMGLQFVNPGNSHSFANAGNFSSPSYSQFSSSFQQSQNNHNSPPQPSMNPIGLQQSNMGMMMNPHQSVNSLSNGQLVFPGYHNVSLNQPTLSSQSCGVNDPQNNVNNPANSYHQLLHTFSSDTYSKQNDYCISSGTVDPLNLVTMQQSNQDEVSIVFDSSFQEFFGHVMDNSIQFSSNDLSTI